MKMTEIGEILKEAQIEALAEAGYEDKLSVRAASDEDLIKVDGIGAATVLKLREWGVADVEQGDAISKRFLVLKYNNGVEIERLNVRPGDIIPAKFGAEAVVKKGNATWE